jgi:hypothetical protein
MRTTIKWWFVILIFLGLVVPASAVINVTAEAVGTTWVTWRWDEGVNVTDIYVDGHRMCGYESTMPSFDMIDLSSCQFHNVSIFSATDYGSNVTTTRCTSPAPGGLTGGEVKPPVVPVETTNLYTPFVLAPILCLAYIFRSVKSDENDEQNEESNPILGDIIVSGVGFILSAMVVIWFIQGISSAPVIIESVSYTLSASDNVAEIQTLLANTTVSEYKINSGGTGMFIRSSISSSEITVSGSSVIVYTHDTVRQLYQDIGVAILYMLLCAILGLLFAWSLLELRRQIQEREYYDENDMEPYGG